MFHEMALAREAVKRVRVPEVDFFAYTPTISPVVHHEWGTGLILFVVTRQFGVAGLIILRYLLAFSTAALVAWIARRRGGSWACIAMVGVLAALPLANGFGTVRAQNFTLLLTGMLLALLEWNEKGVRAWICLWIPVYVVWLNLHGGFVAGVALFSAFIFEALIRGRRGNLPRLVAVLAAMFALTLVNPYGIAYPRYIIHAITMPRPQITEWAPIWHAGPPAIAAFAAIGVLFLYSLLRLGWQSMTGCLMVAAALGMAALHLRHASLAALVACCYLPAWLAMTPLGVAADNLCTRRPGTCSIAASTVALICIVLTLHNAPWRLPVPANGEDWTRHEPVVYPAGATDYLRNQHVTANVMTPFLVGGFVSWKCYPQVKVSIDGRYEVAYEPSLLTEISDFYAGKTGWRQTLERYPTDLVLVPRPSRLLALLADQTAWTVVYRDDAYELWARPGLKLPVVDDRGRHIVASIP